MASMLVRKVAPVADEITGVWPGVYIANAISGADAILQYADHEGRSVEPGDQFTIVYADHPVFIAASEVLSFAAIERPAYPANNE